MIGWECVFVLFYSDLFKTKFHALQHGISSHTGIYHNQHRMHTAANFFPFMSTDMNSSSRTLNHKLNS